MSDCKRYKADFVAYLSGELADNRSQELEKHLSSCKACNTELERMKRIGKAFFSPVQQSVNPFLYTRIEQQLTRPAIKKTLLPVGVLQPLAYAAVLFIGIFLGIQLGTVQKTSETDTHTEAYAETFFFNEMELEPLGTQIWQQEKDNQQEETDEN